jgi:hypothetical protein
MTWHSTSEGPPVPAAATSRKKRFADQISRRNQHVPNMYIPIGWILFKVFTGPFLGSGRRQKKAEQNGRKRNIQAEG